jgi:hypothetical protein
LRCDPVTLLDIAQLFIADRGDLSRPADIDCQRAIAAK